MRRALLFAAVVACASIPQSATAQIFLAESNTTSGAGRWLFDVGGQMANPIGAFSTNVDEAWGIGGAVRYHFRKLAPLGLRGDFTYLNYGRETKHVPLSPSLNRVIVDMNTTNDIIVASVGPELMVTTGPVRPYVYAFAGYSSFFTQSSAGDDDGGGSFASTTNFSDGGLATGVGGGLSIPLHLRSTMISIDAGARLTRNGTRSYLRRGDIIDQADGSLQFTPRTTAADFWQYHLGLSFSPRRR